MKTQETGVVPKLGLDQQPGSGCGLEEIPTDRTRSRSTSESSVSSFSSFCERDFGATNGAAMGPVGAPESSGAHCAQSRVVSEGKLRSIEITLERSDAGELIVCAEARCHGSNMRSRQPGWKGRYCEVALALMRELLSVTRDALEEAVGDLVECAHEAAVRGLEHQLQSKLRGLGSNHDASPRDTIGAPEPSVARPGDAALESLWSACEVALAQQCAQRPARPPALFGPDPALQWPLKEQLEMDAAAAEPESVCTDSASLGYSPGVCIERVEFGSKMRWGGDSSYDPKVDGFIHLRGSCNLEDPILSGWAHSHARDAWHERSDAEIAAALLLRLSARAQALRTSDWAVVRADGPTQRTVQAWCGSGPEGLATITITRLVRIKTRCALVRIASDLPSV